MNRPNIFLLVIDSLRADAIYGDQVPTPNMSAHAERGSVFRQCVCTVTATTPSFSSLLTGCYPPKHGVRGLKGFQLPASLTTMAEALGSAGYHTCAEVTGPLLPATGILRGFDQPRHRPGYGVAFFAWRDEVIARIESFPEPWFLLLHTFEVHRPFRPPPDFVNRWDRSGYEAVVAASDEWLAPVFRALGDNTIVVITGDHGERYPETQLQTRITRVAHWARTNLHTSTTFPALDARLTPLAVGHGHSVDEELVRVPLIIAGPDVPSTVVDQQVRHVDLLPTLAELSGAEASPAVDGRSLQPLMQGEPFPEEPAYMETGGVRHERKTTAVRTAEWKLTKRGTAPPVLYSLDGLYGMDGRSRPDDRTDLCHRHPKVAEELEAGLERVLSSSAAPGTGMTAEEEAVVEQHLRDLGYL